MSFETEPVRLANAITALMMATAPLGHLFNWWTLSADQLAGIETAIIAIGQFASTVFVRARVTPVVPIEPTPPG